MTFEILNWVFHVFVLGIVIEDEKFKIKNKNHAFQ